MILFSRQKIIFSRNKVVKTIEGKVDKDVLNFTNKMRRQRKISPSTHYKPPVRVRESAKNAIVPFCTFELFITPEYLDK